MQKFETKCPHCNAELDAQEDWVGMEVECPACQKSFTVEKNIPAKLELQPIQTNVQQPSENTKNCPFCGGVVKEKAIFCKQGFQQKYQQQKHTRSRHSPPGCGDRVD